MGNWRFLTEVKFFNNEFCIYECHSKYFNGIAIEDEFSYALTSYPIKRESKEKCVDVEMKLSKRV